MLLVESETCPCSAVSKAPPKIAIIWPDPASFVSSPNPRTESPKIVGNIKDMHPEIPTRAYTPM